MYLTILFTMLFNTYSNPINYDVNAHTMEIYEKIQRATGEAERVPELMIINVVNKQGNLVRNAFAYSKDTIIITPSELEFDYANGGDDAVAFVLGHEMAHVMLGHVVKLKVTRDESQVDEAEADKYGAFLMMRAGYNICKGRENWAAMLKETGDLLIQDHPALAYRYNQLDVGCEKE